MKSVFLYVRGNEYARDCFCSEFDPQEFYENMVANRFSSYTLNVEDEPIEVNIVEFNGVILDATTALMKHNPYGYEQVDWADVFEVKPL